jgi:hypothetical protein
LNLSCPLIHVAGPGYGRTVYAGIGTLPHSTSGAHGANYPSGGGKRLWDMAQADAAARDGTESLA